MLLIRAALVLLFWIVPATADQLTLSGLPFPDDVAGFARAEVQDYEKTHPGLGQSVAYAHGPWRADIYVYDERRSAIPDDPSSDIVKEQFEQAKADVFRSQQQRAWAKAELTRTFSLPEHGTPRFNCARFTLVSMANVEIDSTLCVTASKNKFVKFRVSGPRGDAAVPMRFIEAFGPLLWPGA